MLKYPEKLGCSTKHYWTNFKKFWYVSWFCFSVRGLKKHVVCLMWLLWKWLTCRALLPKQNAFFIVLRLLRLIAPGIQMRIQSFRKRSLTIFGDHSILDVCESLGYASSMSVFLLLHGFTVWLQLVAKAFSVHVFFRSSHQRSSVKKDVLRNFTKFTGKHL